MSTGASKGFPPVTEFQPNETEHRRELARGINRLNQGKFNAVIDLTLRASQTTTTLTDSRIYATTFIGWMPQTANASTAERAGMWISSRIKGSCTVNHASNAAIDQTFTFLVIG